MVWERCPLKRSNKNVNLSDSSFSDSSDTLRFCLKWSKTLLTSQTDSYLGKLGRSSKIPFKNRSTNGNCQKGILLSWCHRVDKVLRDVFIEVYDDPRSKKISVLQHLLAYA